VKRAGFGYPLLIAVAVVLMSATLVVTLVPLARCKVCVILEAVHRSRIGQQDSPNRIHSKSPDIRSCPICGACKTCNGRGRRTLLKEWLDPVVTEAE
jgi:hypothetical protein